MLLQALGFASPVSIWMLADRGQHFTRVQSDQATLDGKGIRELSADATAARAGHTVGMANATCKTGTAVGQGVRTGALSKMSMQRADEF